MEKFKSFISEQKNEQPYRMILLMNSTPDDPNKTGVVLEKEAKKMNIPFYQFEVNDGYVTINEKGNHVFHNYSIEKNVKGDVVNEIHDKKGFEIIPENTDCLVRGGDANTTRYAKLLRYSNEKAKSALTILNNEQIKYIKKKLNKGGRHGKNY